MVKTESYQKNRYADFRRDLLEKIDFLKVYREFGVETVGAADTHGWIACRSHESFGGPDTNPSAGINILSGVYKDFRIGDKAMSLFDFAVAIGKYETWQEAQRAIADQCGFKMISISKSHPEHGIKWQPWSDNQARGYCIRKSPVTIEGLKVSGAKMCMRYNEPCFAWEIFDDNLNVIGYYFTPRSGQPFSGETTKGAKSIVKKFIGAEMGIIGRPAAEYLASHPVDKKIIFWCEGGPDLVAAYSIWPESKQFITNPSGCQENVSDDVKKILSGFAVCRIGDADEPGLAGAVKHAQQLTECEKVIVVTAYKNIEDKHGLDLRDYLASENFPGGEPEVLLDLPPYNWEAKIEEAQAKLKAETSRETATMLERQQNVLKELGIQVISSSIHGELVLECTVTNRIRVFRSIREIQYLEMAAFCGITYLGLVSMSQVEQEAEGKSFTHSDVMKALTYAIVQATSSPFTKVGSGIWNVSGEIEGFQLAIVQNASFITVEQNELVKHDGYKFHQFIIDYEDLNPWFNEDNIRSYFKMAADVSWRKSVYDQVMSLLARWPWRDNNSPVILSGLIYATWLQSVLPWRPIACLVGESSSGKTTFFERLHELFLKASNVIAWSTPAGVMQSLQYRSLPLIIDEFDRAKQKQFFELFRGNSRGQTSFRGTANQQGKSYRLKHLPWIGGIFSGASAQADKNRMLEFNLVLDKKRFDPPTDEGMQDLGEKILASVLYVAPELLKRYNQIKHNLACKRAFDRQYESLAIPCAAIATILEMRDEEAISLLENQRTEYDSSQDKVASDQDSMLDQIAGASVRLKVDGTAYSTDNLPDDRIVTLADILMDPEMIQYAKQLIPLGFTVVKHEGVLSLGIHPKTVRLNAWSLKLEEMDSDSQITTLLSRVSIVRSSRRFYLGARQVIGLIIPIEELRTWLSLPAEQRK